MRETSIFPLGMGVTPGPEPDDKDTRAIELVITEGAMLPIPGPDGQPIMFPVGNIRVPITKEVGLQVAEKLKVECGKLPDESKVIQATDLKEADRLAALEQRLRP